jgi:hypothetical protein
MGKKQSGAVTQSSNWDSDMGTIILTLPEGIIADTPVGGKFLQVHWRGTDYLLFAAATEHRYHNQLLAWFLARHDVRHDWADDQTLVVDHRELLVTGGGRFLLDANRRSLRVWDESSVYGRFDASRLAAQIKAAGAPWGEFTLELN